MSQSFLQSTAWGEFQTAVGHRAVQFEGVQGYEHRLGFGMRYVYLPRYAVDDKRYLDALANHFSKQSFAFLRIEPGREPVKDLSPITYHLSPTHNRQPQHTLLVDLAKSEDGILSAMHPKTRYNIHLAERHGVVVREERNPDIFWRLFQETAARDKFRGHPKIYYEKMLAMPIARQLTVYLGDVPVASHILIVFGDTCTYLHGASSNEHRNTMAPYLLQWEGMKLGKKSGCGWYDFWGVAPSSQQTCFHGYCWDPAHPWSGITRFKAGFGGVSVSYPQAFDVILSPTVYRLYTIVRRLRRMV